MGPAFHYRHAKGILADLSPLWRYAALLLWSLVPGCTSSSAKPGDEVGVTCHGQEWAHCFRLMDKRCGSGQYQLLSQITDVGSSANGNNESLIRGTFVQRTLVARCTDGKSKNPNKN